MLLFGFAMVVPPAVAIGYILYWRRTTEAGASLGDDHRIWRRFDLVRAYQVGVGG